jgi:hypothetical protein
MVMASDHDPVRASMTAREAADRIVELERQGIDGEHVTVQTPPVPEAGLDPEGIAGTVGRRAGVGAAIGAVIGGVATAVLMVSVGPSDASAAAVVGAAAGAGILFGALGGLFGVFGGLATSESWSRARAAEPDARAVVEVHTHDPSEAATARDVLGKDGA